jgi:hypothetical protein
MRRGPKIGTYHVSCSKCLTKYKKKIRIPCGVVYAVVPNSLWFTFTLSRTVLQKKERKRKPPSRVVKHAKL